MKFLFATVFALAAIVLASPAEDGREAVKRQTAQVAAQQPAMTDADGNVIAFDASSVYVPSRL